MHHIAFPTRYPRPTDIRNGGAKMLQIDTEGEEMQGAPDPIANVDCLARCHIIQKQPQNFYQDENVGGVPHLLAVEHDEQHEGVADDAEDGDEGEDDGHDVRD